MKNSFSKRILMMAAVLSFGLALSACSSPKEPPETVIEKFKSASTEINSGDLNLDLSVKGVDAQDNLDFTGMLGLKFDRTEELNPKADITVGLEGKMQAAGRSLSGDLDFTLRGLATDFYVRLEKLDSSDPNIEMLKPLITPYTKKWLKLSSEMVPESLRQIQAKDQAAREQERQLKDLFKVSQLFTVNKEYGVESINGHKAYHYGIKLDPEGVKEYLQAAAVIQGRALEEQELQSSLALISSVTSAELWIGAKDYYLYKLTASVSTPAHNSVSMNADVTLEAKAYNKRVKIEAPKDAQEFNPFGALGAVSPSAGTSPAPAE